MPVPQRFARGDVMGRGPYEKSGIVEDTALPPGEEAHERFEIFFPAEELENKAAIDEKMDINVKLWYLPYGNKKSGVVWRDYDTSVTISQSQGDL